MIPIAMLLLGLPIGRFCQSARQAVVLLLAAFLVVLIVQSIVVLSAGDDGLPPAYWLVQIASLAGGLLLTWGGVRLRRRGGRLL
jgi:hypothetical protein